MALRDIWAAVQGMGADRSLLLAFLMISASWMAVELIKVLVLKHSITSDDVLQTTFVATLLFII